MMAATQMRSRFIQRAFNSTLRTVESSAQPHAVFNAPLSKALPTKPHSILSCATVNQGKQLVVEFGDNSRYELHSSWLKDASPANAGADFYRKSAKGVLSVFDHTISTVEPSSQGDQMLVKYSSSEQASEEDVIESKWLHSLAPFVGKPLDASSATKPQAVVKNTGSILDSRIPKRRGWYSDIDMPTFDANTMLNDIDEQVKFIENMVDTGVAMIHNIGTAPLDMDSAGKPIEDFVERVIARLNQHPVRRTRYGHMQNKNKTQGADYDHSNPLSMHTDHTVYHGTPGYIQFLHQVQGNVSSKVCDGLAISEYLKEHHPEAYKLLTEVHVTHSSRNAIYTPDGSPRNLKDPSSVGVPFELVHTHPVIQLDENGFLEKVAQSETKRGVCALPYSVYEPYMRAYQLWVNLVEQEQFIKKFDWPEGSAIVTNNWRVMHGRASVPPGMERTMCWGYVSKVNLENRYRLLKQQQMERDHPTMNHRWTTRVPNQALSSMLA